jgi:uncharacterized protein YjlB
MTDISPAQIHLDDDGTYPNSHLPVLLWRGAVLTDDDFDTAIELCFRANDWTGVWRNGIFTFNHYHSTAHEVLGVARGTVDVLLGGPKGTSVELYAGDIVLLPAGTSHCNQGQSRDLLVIGAYPPGQHPDILRGDPGERPGADDRIATVPLPQSNPITGESGPPLPWRQAGE